jgi:hypothetical protein
MLREPKEIEIDGKTFVISKFPSLAGYEIVTQLTLTAIPKLAEFKEHRAMFIKMLAYTGVKVAGIEAPLMLTTEALIDNHTNDWEMMGKLAYSVYEYNVSFLERGSLSNFLQNALENLPDFAAKMYQKWSQQSSPKKKRAITS